MLQIDGYKLIEEINNNNHVIIYRALKKKSSQEVIIKLLKNEYPKPEEIIVFERKYDISKSLQHLDGVCTYLDLIDIHETKAIVMSDCGGISLKEAFADQKKIYTLEEKLTIAIGIAKTLQHIHNKHVIHKDICPANILLNPDTLAVHIIDFSIASRFSRQIQNIISLNKLEGSLAYISPEQTGRMNRSVDYRTDFYSLGCVLFELFTGHRPFETRDPMELVHSHLARTPSIPEDISDKIPQVLIAIIMKLMEKMAEKRYQSSKGLLSDLNRCHRLLVDEGNISAFKIGENDLTEKLQLSENIYGRDKEKDILLKAFSRVVGGGKETVFVSGQAGIGKSSLSKEIFKATTNSRAFFLSGKYSELKQNIPYSGFIQAFDSLTRYLISEKKEIKQHWKEDILKSVKNNGQILIDLIPSLKLIIGNQPTPEPLAISESQNRLNTLLLRFISIFAAKDHPIVFLLDDLQWIDMDSVKLIKTLLSDREYNYTMFIGLYRNSNIKGNHPLQVLQEWLSTKQIPVTKINLKSLPKESISKLLSDSLEVKESEVKKLTDVIYDKTNGNPFYIHEFIKEMFRKEYFYFSETWNWDINKIQESNITEDIAKLLVNRLKDLNIKSLEILKYLYCLGRQSKNQIITLVTKKNFEEFYDDIREITREGFIIWIGDEIKFAHDLISEAVSYFIKNSEKKEIHYKIGTSLLESNINKDDPNIVFALANQFNAAGDFLPQKDGNLVGRLNKKSRRIGQKSKCF